MHTCNLYFSWGRAGEGRSANPPPPQTTQQLRINFMAMKFWEMQNVVYSIQKFLLTGNERATPNLFIRCISMVYRKMQIKSDTLFNGTQKQKLLNIVTHSAFTSYQSDECYWGKNFINCKLVRLSLR